MSLADLFRQLSILIGLPAVLLAGAGAAIIVIARDWRLSLFGYAVVSVMLSLLLSQIIPTAWALMQAIAGGLIAVILFLSARQLREVSRGDRRATRWPIMASLTSFRVLAVGLATVTFVAIRSKVPIPGLEPLFRDAVSWLILMSLLGLALHEEPLHAGLCLLTFLAGSELLLFTLIQRQMLVGLWLGGQVLLGLAIAYLVLARGLAPARNGAPALGENGANGGRP
jgi:hypothetical protein